MTIGDCWGIENHMPDMDDDKGTSVIMVHSSNGERMLEGVRGNLRLREANLDTVLPPTADSRKSVEMHPNRRKYWEDVKNGESFEATMKRLGITEEDDIAIFKAANKEALSRSKGGWFKVGEKEVVIPKQLVEKLNMLADTSNFVDGSRELAKWHADKRK